MSFYEPDPSDRERKLRSLDELRKEIEAIDLSPSAPDKNFTILIQVIVSRLPLTDRDLAAGVSISLPTARRWIHGVTSPHAAMREVPRRFALRYISNLRELL